MRRLDLVLVDDGAELRDRGDSDRVLWSSDDDEDFLEEFQESLVESDLDDIVDYLLDSKVLTEAEADHMEVWEETESEDEDPDDESIADDDGDEY